MTVINNEKSKELKILILLTALALVKTKKTSKKLPNQSSKSYIFCIKKGKYLKSIQQYNVFNKGIKENGTILINSEYDKTSDTHTSDPQSFR